ncbi:hypothetical protein SBF1_5130004 [Candidatus Desulfosporosinus infrequens]|uniref:Uncharacterized protein n=1 Tax=Candidatus Desulfosporosinus infrequens TaxID=2043169 RepID=A0A2U3LI92_9FIRM|nr:hypothetical protein SBF1_5130004 [Candidatus Desulfosporosinus infrequens]
MFEASISPCKIVLDSKIIMQGDMLNNGIFKSRTFCSWHSEEVYSGFEQFLKTETISDSTTYGALLIAYRFLHYFFLY